jgi:hypothetical protein
MSAAPGSEIAGAGSDEPATECSGTGGGMPRNSVGGRSTGRIVRSETPRWDLTAAGGASAVMVVLFESGAKRPGFGDPANDRRSTGKAVVPLSTL